MRLQLGTQHACSVGNKPNVMKKISFILSLVSLSLTVTSASAAVQNDTETVRLPDYRVEAERYTEAEKTIEQNLATLRDQARPACRVRITLPDLGKVAVQPVAHDGREVAVQPAVAPARS